MPLTSACEKINVDDPKENMGRRYRELCRTEEVYKIALSGFNNISIDLDAYIRGKGDEILIIRSTVSVIDGVDKNIKGIKRVFGVKV